MPNGRSAALPRIVEVKRLLRGGEKRFDCQVLERAGDHLVVLFVAPEAMSVHGVSLPAGTITFGHFWSDRPYNVYHWLDAATGATIGCYFNLAADTRIGADLLEWRDLVVDVLMLPGGRVTVLDEDEIPADTPAELRRRIGAAKAAVLRDPVASMAELERHRQALWPRVRGDGGAGGGGRGGAP